MAINYRQEEVRVLAVSSFSSSMDAYNSYTRCIGCEQELTGQSEQEIFKKYNQLNPIHSNLGKDPSLEVLYQYRTGQHRGYLEWSDRWIGSICDGCGMLLLGRTFKYIEDRVDHSQSHILTYSRNGKAFMLIHNSNDRRIKDGDGDELTDEWIIKLPNDVWLGGETLAEVIMALDDHWGQLKHFYSLLANFG